MTLNKLGSHEEVVDSIIRGFEKEGVSYNQTIYTSYTGVNYGYPCGTQFCLLGAIVTDFYTRFMTEEENHKQVRENIQKLADFSSYSGDSLASALLGDDIWEEWYSDIFSEPNGVRACLHIASNDEIPLEKKLKLFGLLGDKSVSSRISVFLAKVSLDLKDGTFAKIGDSEC